MRDVGRVGIGPRNRPTLTDCHLYLRLVIWLVGGISTTLSGGIVLDISHVIPRGKKLEMLNRFIEAFKNVVCAPTETQMKALWWSLFEEGQFPWKSVEYLRREYYDHPELNNSWSATSMMPAIYIKLQLLARRVLTALFGLMLALFRKCRTPTSNPNYGMFNTCRNYGLRQSEEVIPPDLDIELFPELRELARKVSQFALREIRQQITPAKREEANGNVRNPWNYGERCYCHSFRRFGLPFRHMVPTDRTAIPLDKIAPFWRIDNWDRGTMKLECNC